MLKNGSFSWIVISRGPNFFVDEAWQEQEESPQDVEMVSYTCVEQSFAMTTIIEKSNASKEQEQSSIPMNRFIHRKQQAQVSVWRGFVH